MTTGSHAPALLQDDIDDTSVLSALRSPARLRVELLAGLAVALALIPEAISFSILAGSIHASVCSRRSRWRSRSRSPAVGER